MTDTATVTEAAPSSAPTAEAPATPAPPPVSAPAEDLAAAVAAHTTQIRGQAAGRTDRSAEDVLLGPRSSTAVLSGTAEQAATDASAVHTTEVQGQQAAKPEPDPVATNIARYLEQTRLAREARKAAQQEREAVARERQAIEAERAERAKETSLRELAKRDPVAATKALLGDQTLRGNFVVDLLNRMAAEEAGQEPQVSEAEREAQLVEKTRAAIKAEQDAEEAARKAEADRQRQVQTEQNQRAKEAFFTGLVEQFKGTREQYPFLAAEPVDIPTIDKWLEGEFQRTGKIATPAEIFAHFETQQEARAQKLAAVVERKRGGAATPPAKGAAGVAPVPRPLDTRGAVTPPAASKRGAPDLRAARDAIAARLDAANRH